MTGYEFQQLRKKYDVAIATLAHRSGMDEDEIMDFENECITLPPETVNRLAACVKKAADY